MTQAKLASQASFTDLFGHLAIRALSWKEPYATLMLHGKIETRRWATTYRGLVLICASKTPYTYRQTESISGEKQLKRMYALFQFAISPLHCGYAIAIGELVDCRHMRPEDEDKCFVRHYSDLYCHVYANVRPIQPIEWKGSQGWRVLSEEQKARIHLL